MKQPTIILDLILLFSIGLAGQDYVPFPTEKVNWNVLYAGTCREEIPDTTLIRYTIHGDTTIYDTQYSKLCVESGDTLNPEIQPIGGLREADKKVYYIGQTIIAGGYYEEFLLYDFTAEIGDTIIHKTKSCFHSVVLDIDSVMIGEHYRKRYKVDNNWYYHNPDYIIEGIGSVKNGLLGHISDITTCGTHYWEHVCFRENGIVKYLNPAFNNCFPDNLLSGIAEHEMVSDIDIYPNPFSNELHISNKLISGDMIFKLIDIKGNSLFEKRITGEKITFNMNISSGVYTALIIDENGDILISKKMVKE